MGNRYPCSVLKFDVKRSMTPQDIAEVTELLEAVERADAHKPLNDHLWIDLRLGGRSGFAGLTICHPDNVEALNALGYTLLNNPGRYAEAEKFLRKALALEPNEAVIIDSYGWLQFKLGNFEAALKYLQQAYEKQPENEIAAHLAEVLWVLDRKDEAKKIFNKAIKGSLDDEYLQDFQRRVLKGE